MAGADEAQFVVEDAEDGVVCEIEVADVVVDHVVRHDLAETQQAIIFVEREKMGEETLTVARGQLANENRCSTGVRQRASSYDGGRGKAVDGNVHDGFSLESSCDVLHRKTDFTRLRKSGYRENP